MSPACSLFALVRQTLRFSVSTPVSVPTKVLPWLVTTLTCFWSRLDSSSMNLRPAVEDIFDYRGAGNCLPRYHLWSNRPRRAFDSPRWVRASQEHWAV